MRILKRPGTDTSERVPHVWGALKLLLFRPHELWGRMVFWRLDGDPGLLLISRPATPNQRAWSLRVAQICLMCVASLLALLLLDFGWQSKLLTTFAGGAILAVALYCFVGIAFAAVMVTSLTFAIFVGSWLPQDFAGLDVTGLLSACTVGLAVRTGWIVSEHVFDDGQALLWNRSSHDLIALAATVVFFVAYTIDGSPLEALALLGAFVAAPVVQRMIEAPRRRRREDAYVFISYEHRHAASSAFASRLYEALGPESAFKDTGIPYGEPLLSDILAALHRSSTVIALIHPDWMEKAEDYAEGALPPWCQLEVGYARRLGVSIIPVLLEGAHLPAALATLNAAVVDADDADAGIARIVKQARS